MGANYFSDKEKFNLDGTDGYKFYWRDLRRPPRRYLSRQKGGGSLMHLLPFAHRNYGTDFIFMQDNASIYASNETTTFFKDIGVTLLEWPARSPDLYPIENVWATLADNVYSHKKQYKSVES
ncbi:unnamed protein product [Phytophthora fragariaefolia]|uniref:Unnamed protein product n=1 Tax=Phytophthora fragariaefolia TaxID=1490495 RepID=A0A9W6XKP7_9STRA|nr:unnamed protein product [Phytophthora fragariaefolia]